MIQQGKKARTAYKKEFGNEILNRIHFYSDTKDNFVLESFLTNNDIDIILKLTKSTDIKRAFGFLFYDYKSKQMEFVKNLSKETLNNLSSTIKRIAELD